MLKKRITYKDFNDEEVTEEYFFNLSKAELIELEVSHEDGLSVAMQRILDSEDGAGIIREFKKIILLAYGKKSSDGKRFIKNQTMRDEFESSEAYSTLFMELCTDADSAVEFMNGIIPANLEEEVDKITARQAQRETPVAATITHAELVAMPQSEFMAAQKKIAAGDLKLLQDLAQET